MRHDFLSLAAATIPPSLGEVLEIGSFKGKSTTLIAKSVALVGGDRVCAVDPLFLPSVHVPPTEKGDSLPDIFRQTLSDNGVEQVVEFHQMPSEALAATWDRPLRFLWIDGDHTYPGAMADFVNFSHHLQPGAVIAFHDTLHPSEGPIRTFCEKVLLSPLFGPCGMCGSIGWAQYLGARSDENPYMNKKMSLYRKVNRLIQFVAFGKAGQSHNPLGWKLLRPLVPHGNVNARKWQAAIAKKSSRRIDQGIKTKYFDATKKEYTR